MRRLVWLSSAGLGVIMLVTLVALIGSSLAHQQSLEAVERDAKSTALAREIEVSVLMYQRLSNLQVVTGESDLAAAKGNLKRRMQRLLEQSAEHVGSAGERGVLDRIETALGAYFAQRHDLEARGLDLEEVVHLSRPALGQVLRDLTALRELNDAQVVQVRADARRMDWMARGVGLSAGLVMILGLLAIGFGVRRYLLTAILSLHGAMKAFRQGDMDVRALTGGVREVDELALIFNEMADMVARQRKAQLTFLSGVAHDLRNPLSTLKTGMYALEYEQSEKRRSSLRLTLDRQLDLLNRMVGDLLDATRIEAGELSLQPDRFDLRRLVEDMVRLYQPTAPGHRIVSSVSGDVVTIRADPLRIEQVVRNLIGNAIKFSPAGGTIQVSVTEEKGSALLSVSDQGIGIPAEDLPDLFLPFRRRKLSLAPGAGLGLSVVRRIVVAHGGSIDVRSEPDAGSTFLIRLPAAVEGRIVTGEWAQSARSA